MYNSYNSGLRSVLPPPVYGGMLVNRAWWLAIMPDGSFGPMQLRPVRPYMPYNGYSPELSPEWEQWFSSMYGMSYPEYTRLMNQYGYYC